MTVRVSRIVVLWLAVFAATLGEPAAQAAQVSVPKPVGLRCEYQNDPVGVDEPFPRLSWRLQAEDSARGVMQVRYHILVASSTEVLARNQGDLWDAEVKSSASAQIPYAGRSLAPNRVVYWKVQVTDGAGKLSAWSDPARWSVGLLQVGNWRAQWIGLDNVPPSKAPWLPPSPPKPDDKKDAPEKVYVPVTMLRKEFSLASAPKRAVLYVTALGNVEPRLNGHSVAEEYFTPGWTDYHQRLYYRAYDVTALVHAGTNALGALLADGWFRGNVGAFGQNRYGKHTRLRAELHLFDGKGQEQVIASDPSWKVGTGPILEADMQAGESYDARLEVAGWDAPGFDDHTWKAPDIGAEFEPTIIRSHPAPPVRRVGERKTVAVTQPKPGIYVFDLGQNFAGFARLQVQEPAGTVIHLRFAEMLQPDGTGWFEGNRTARATDTYVCKGGGGETWEPRFTYHGFRYVQVQGLTKPPVADTITGVVLSSANPEAGAFECSSPLLNQIWSNTWWGQRSNYLEVPTDCPQRDERLGWTGDAQLFVRTAAYNEDIVAFMSKWVDDLVDTQSPDGRFNDTAPVGFRGTSAGWADAGIIVPWTLWQVYGDTRVLERHYDAMRRYVEYQRKAAPDGIGPNRGYGDWIAVGGITEKNLISTAYYGHVVQQMADIADALGKSEDAATYRSLFETIRAAFQKKFINPDGSIGEHRSQTAHLLALRFDLLTPAQRAAAIPHLISNLEDRNWRIGLGFLGVNLLLPTLTDTGHTDGAYYVITGREFPSWGYSIDQGATTIWERWNSFTKARGFDKSGMNSFNHYAYGSCVEWLYRTVLGIDAVDVGFSRVVIHPQPGPGVTSARGHYDSIHGRIETVWQIANGQLTLEVVLPPNTSAEIHVPAKSAEVVREAGQPVATAAGLKLERVAAGDVVFGVGSGHYRFTAPYAAPEATVQPPVPGKSNAAEEERGPAQFEPAADAAFSVDTKIGVLLQNPAAKAVLQKHIPEALANPEFAEANGTTLRELNGFSPEYFTTQKLQAIAADLARIAASGWSVNTTKVGDLLDNPRTQAVLEKDMPEAVNNPDFAQARGMTLAKLQEFSPDYFTAARLKAIQDDLDKLNGGAAATPVPATPSSEPAKPKPQGGGQLGVGSKIGALLDDPRTRPVLAKHLGAMVDSPQFAMARGLTLQQLQPYVKNVLTDAVLAEIGTELAAIPVTQSPAGAFSADSKMGDLLANSAARAVLVKYLPKLMASSQIDQSRELTLRDLQKYFPDLLTRDNLNAIAAELAAPSPDDAGPPKGAASVSIRAAPPDAWSADVMIGQLMDNPGTLAVLMKHLPEVFGNSQIAAAREMPLRKLQPYVPMMTDAVLNALDRDLRAVPVTAGTVIHREAPGTTDPLKLVTIPLWEKGAPGALGDRAVDCPSLTVIAPEAVQRNGTAIIVAPGGAYQGLATNHEGRQVADWFAAHGVTAFVLTYRLISSGYFHPTQLNDGQRAVRWVRAHAKEYGVNPDRIGMIGFSAGGHLTTMVATRADSGKLDAADPVDRMSSKLDFMVLCYPGVMGTANLTTALLGPHPDPSNADFVNTEKYLSKDTPPTFIFQTADDQTVALGRVQEFQAALEKAGVPVEMHVYPHGPHGMGLALQDPALRDWPVQLEKWLAVRGLITADPAVAP